MLVSLYLLCWNEEEYIKNTIEYYNSRFPNIKITILDNYSTDLSVEIAKTYGANIIKWGHPDIVVPYKNINDNPHNTFWKNEPNDTWIITCDCDELLDINLEQLKEEDKLGTTIIKTNGYEVVGESQKEDLSDINYYELNRGILNPTYFSKNILFKNGEIKEINYEVGQHKCNPKGNVIFSNNIYMIYHMKWLGLKYFVKRMLLYKKRFKNHYQYNSVDEIIEHFNNVISKANNIPKLKHINIIN